MDTPRLAARLVAFSLVVVASSTAMAQYTQPNSYGTPAPGLEAGGLAPPGAGYDPARPSGDTSGTQTEQSLREADEKDSGRGLEFFWVNGEVGYEILGLQTFRTRRLVDAEVVKSTENGVSLGAGAGVRLVFVTLGGRFRMGLFDAWQLWTLNAELGLRIPIGNIEPYVTVGGGYAQLGGLDSGSDSLDLDGAGVSVRGFDARAGFGIDFYLSPVVSVGANLTGEALVLSRSGVSRTDLNADPTPDPDDPAAAAADVYARDGSGIGAATTFSAVVGLHF